MEQSPIDLPSTRDAILESRNAKRLVAVDDILALPSYMVEGSPKYEDTGTTLKMTLNGGYLNVWTHEEGHGVFEGI